MMQNRDGFSLVEVLIAIGLMGFAGFALMNMISGQQKAIGEAERQMEEMDVIQRLRLAFADKVGCTHTLVGVCSDVKLTSQRSCEAAGNTWTDKALASGDTFNTVYGNRGRTDSDILFKVGQTFGSGNKEQVKLDSFKFIASNVSDGQTNGSVEVSLLRNKGKGNWVPGKKAISLVVAMGGGKVRECYSDYDNMVRTAQQKSCESAGGVWNLNENNCSMAELTTPFGYSANVAASTKFVKDTVDQLKKTMVTLPTDESCGDGYYMEGITLDQGQLGIACKKLPSPPEPLYGGSHTNVNCQSLSNSDGVVEVDYKKLCKIGATTCPAGWVMYKFQHAGRDCTGGRKSGQCWFQGKSCDGSSCTTSASDDWTTSLRSGCTYHDGNWDIFCNCNSSGTSHTCDLSSSYITKILCY